MGQACTTCWRLRNRDTHAGSSMGRGRNGGSGTGVVRVRVLVMEKVGVSVKVVVAVSVAVADLFTNVLFSGDTKDEDALVQYHLIRCK